MKKAKAGLSAGATGVTANWTEQYAYDRYGNRQTVTPSGVTANNQAVPSDGLPNQSYDAPSNRINTSGYLYDLMGNLTRGQDASGNWQTYEYDQAGRMLRVRDASNNILETHFYAADRNRYGVENPSQRTYYVWGGASVLEEYTEPLAGNTPTYSKSYIYAGARLLSTYTNNNGTETLQLQHPDRLGTKLVTNPQSATQFEQATLPFGTSLDAETTGTTNERFTSYDRSSVSSLDYAVNRSYSAAQSRFTQVDPSGMGATSKGNPQSNNLYAYVENNPIDNVDPSGLDILKPEPNPHIKIKTEYVTVKGDNPFLSDDWLEFAAASKELMNRPLLDMPRYPGGSSGGGESGGGAGHTSTPAKKDDPCAGKKGNKLDFSKKWNNHIFPLHVATQDPQWSGKSKYVFYLSEWTKSQYESSVSSTGQTTFEKGVYADGGDGKSVYTYAFPGIDLGDELWIMQPIGYDGKTKAMTNVNTIIVGTDCQTVVTTHPGLPFQFNAYDIPGAMFKTNGYTFKHKAYNF